MAKHGKQTASNSSSSTIQTSHLLPHVRYNPATSSSDYFFPLKLENPAIEESARLRGYQIGWTKLGNETFRAAMIPCKQKACDAHGNEVFIDTSEEEQHARYNELIREASSAQKRKLHDGCCSFYRNGMRHRCPTFIPNPNFDPSRPPDNRTNPKTVLNRCDGCGFARFKEAHDVLPFSVFEKEDENGEKIPFERGESFDAYEFESFDGLAAEAKAILHRHKPSLDKLVDLLAKEMTQADAARALGKRASTVNSQQKVFTEAQRDAPGTQSSP